MYKLARLREHRLLILSWALVIAFLATYWLQIHSGLQKQTRMAEALATQGIAQTSHALALQTEALLRKLDYVSSDLVDRWLSESESDFRVAAKRAQKTLEDGAMLNVLVVDETGRAVFSGLDRTPGAARNKGVSIGDREHFQAHFINPRQAPAMFISRPTLGRITQQWAVLLTRPIDRNGERVGVLVLSVSAQYLSQALRDVYTDPQDAALLVRNDGTYVARSYGIEKVLGTTVPHDREFVTYPDRKNGLYQVVAPVDHVERYYAWHRLADYPLVVSVGISKAKAMASVSMAQQDIYRRNILGTVLVLILMTVVSILRLKADRQARSLRIAHERLHITLHSAHDGVWSWHADHQHIEWDAGLYKMLGLPSPSGAPSEEAWTALIHPQDLSRVACEWLTFLQHDGDTAFNSEVRMVTGEGRGVWVSVRARVVERDDAQRPLLVVGTYTDVDERVRATQLRHLLLDQSSAAIVLANAKREVIFANERFIALFGPTPHGEVGSLRSLHVDEQHADMMAPYYELLRKNGRVQFEFPLKDQQGHKRWFSIQGLLSDMNEPHGDVVWTLSDTTDRHAADEALYIERQRLDVLIERFPGGVLMEDTDDRVVLVNRVAMEWLGLSDPIKSLAGLSHADLLQRLGHKATWLRNPQPPERREAGAAFEVEDSGNRTLEVKRFEISEQDKPLGQVWLLYDITERKARERALTALASTDPLTGLPNRRSFMGALELSLSRSLTQATAGCAVLMMDLDFFKRVNDTYGHPVGDAVLQETATRLRACLRQGDVAGRLGGEEFAVVLENITPQDALNKANAIRACIAASPISTEGGDIHVSLSIGVALAQANLTGANLLANADKALYEAKRHGRDRVECWQSSQGN